MGGLSQRQARFDAGVPEPVLRYEPNDMWLEFAFDAAYLKVLRAGQKQTPQVTEQVTEQVERLIAALNDQTLSLQELMLSLGLSHRPNFMALYLRPALDAKYLQMTVPDKPNSRLQKYKLTVLGRQWLTHRNKA
jgi:ATP-dependent DNA helicase RecG